MVNVPNALWIDGDGVIVRPAEPAWPGRTPVIDDLDDLPVPPQYSAVHDEIKKMHIDPVRYLAMLVDWAERGAARSGFVLPPDEVVARSRARSMDWLPPRPTSSSVPTSTSPDITRAAVPHWREAHRLDPDNWTYKRQAWNLESGDTVTRTSAYEGSWLEDVLASGAEQYYPEIQP